MPFSTSKKTQTNIVKIKELLAKEELWSNEIGRRLKIRPEMMNYYRQKYLSKEIEVVRKEGNNKLLRLKKEINGVV